MPAAKENRFCSRWTLALNSCCPEEASERGKPIERSDGSCGNVAHRHSQVQNLIDAQAGLEKLGAAATGAEPKRHFLAEALKRAEFRGELENILYREGVRDLHETGTAAGAVKRAWVGLRATLGVSDESLASSAGEEEDASLQAYTDALQHDLPLPIRQVLATQAAHVEQERASYRSGNSAAA